MEAGMTNHKDMNMHMEANTQNEHPSTSASETQEEPASCSASSSASQAADSPGTDDVAKGGIPGSSLFQGLSHLLHTCLVLGALNARDKFLGALAAIKEDSDNFDAVNELTDHKASCSEVESDYTDTTDGVTTPSLSRENQTAYINGISEGTLSEAASDGDDTKEKPESRANYPLAWNARDPLHSLAHPDGPLIEQIPVHSGLHRDPSIDTGDQPQPQAIQAEASRGQTYQDTTRPQPLFPSFTKPHLPSPPQGTDESASQNFDNLSRVSRNLPPSSLDTESSSSSDDPADKAPSPPTRSKWLCTPRKVITGEYRREPVQIPETRYEAYHTPYQHVDPPVRTVSAARKPTIIQSLVRRKSYQSTMVIGEVDTDGAVGETYSELEEAALAPCQ
ncbi:MAG: hypothetical protein Q9211_002371 [Gyalolechia sp. 1 TL-2023]